MKSVIELVIKLVFLANIHVCFGKLYDNYSIYNVYPQNSGDQKLLQNMARNINLDVIFTEHPQENRIVQALVNNKSEADFLQRTVTFNVRTRKIADSAQKVFDDQLFQGSPFRRRNKWETFQPLENVYKWLNESAKQYPHAYLESIGKSSEGRDIYAFSIKIPPRPNYSNLKAIIEGSMHGNEWLSAAATLYMIEHVLNATTGPYEALKKKYFLYFIPIINPDGYEYSQKHDPLWKKNRRRTGNDTIGVNLNRNFDYRFGEFDSSPDKHSQYYPGPYPFSEPETSALKEFVYRKRNQISFYFSIHGHGQKFILPYADSVKHVVNYHEVQSFAKQVISKMTKGPRSQYEIGLASEVLGFQYSGDSSSWVKKNFHVPYTMTIQLRDCNEKGIALPNSEIEESSRELSEGLTNFMISTGRFRSYEDNSSTIIKSNMMLILIFLLSVIY